MIVVDGYDNVGSLQGGDDCLLARTDVADIIGPQFVNHRFWIEPHRGFQHIAAKPLKSFALQLAGHVFREDDSSWIKLQPRLPLVH